MTTTIAVAGKGGTGKTTVASLIIDHLGKNGRGSILAVDADPSTNLNIALGVEVYDTVGDVREETVGQIRSGGFSSGMNKESYLEVMIRQSLVEADTYDLLTMGRPEGPGCYCAPNHILRRCIDQLSGGYTYVVIDNEAGLEHLSRRTTRDVEHLIIVSDPTMRGLIAAERVLDIVRELELAVMRSHLVINRTPPDGIPAPLLEEIEKKGLPLLGTIPLDTTVMEMDASGLPIVSMPQDAPSRRALVSLLEQVLS